MKYKYLHLFVFPVMFFLTSCLNNQSEIIQEDSRSPDAYVFRPEVERMLHLRKSFTGTINGGVPVQIDLRANNGELEGFAWVKKTGKRMPIKGKITARGNIEAEVLLATGLKHQFKAEVIDDELKGGFIDHENQRTDAIDTKAYFVSKRPNKDLQWVQDPGLDADGFQQILWLQKPHDPTGRDSLLSIKVNTEYVYTCPKPIRAILGYYSTLAGVVNTAQSSDSSTNYADLRNAFIEALDFDYQGSAKQRQYLEYWFRKDKSTLEQIRNGYITANSADWFRQFDAITMKAEADSVKVRFSFYDCDMNKADQWEIKGEGVFKIDGDMISLVNQRMDTLKVKIINPIADRNERKE